jgi:hypothetical protein
VTSYNSGNGEWYVTTTNPNLWENNVTYDVYVRAHDKAGNYQSSQISPSTFTFSFQPPPSVITITKPVGSRFYKENLTSNLGTVNEATIRVEIQIERLSDGKYWSGTSNSWVVSSTYTAANGVAFPNWTWNANFPASGDWFVHGSSYTVRARGVNSANITGAQVSLTFTYDDQAPTSVITNPLTQFTSSFIQIAGTGSDQLNLAGISSIKVDIERATKNDTTAADNYFWSGSTWVAVRPNLNASINLTSPNLWNWNYNIAYSTWFTDGYKYKLYVFAEDDAYLNNNAFDGNDEGEHGADVVYDISIPTATITSFK